MLSETLLCPACGARLRFKRSGARLCCSLASGSTITDGLIDYEPIEGMDVPSEIATRDRQAAGYLAHGKFPIQIHRLREFIGGLHGSRRRPPVLDLGCGPGPTTLLLLEAGFDVVAIDFSRESLRLNAQRCGAMKRNVLFVAADLNRVAFARESASGLMMADFLQHLGDLDAQKQFLAKAFGALLPSGWFFLSFFNANLKNRVKGDIDGSFSGGSIRYRRLALREAREMLPEDIVVERILPMNIFNKVTLDRLAARLPFARHLARMVLIHGRKQ